MKNPSARVSQSLFLLFCLCVTSCGDTSGKSDKPVNAPTVDPKPPAAAEVPKSDLNSSAQNPNAPADAAKQPVSPAVRETGTVKWFNEQKGFGFIAPDNGGKDLFCHHSEIIKEGFKTLKEGQKVEYERVADSKGPKAVKIKPLD